MALAVDKDFYQFLKENQKFTALRKESILIHIIDKSLELKSKIVEIDETAESCLFTTEVSFKDDC